MPIKYYEIKSLLRTHIKLIDSIMNKVLKYVLLYGFIIVFFSMGNVNNDKETTIYFILLILMGVIYRFNVLFERVEIKNLSLKFKRSQVLKDEQIQSLVSEIELSLAKVNNFTNWSCGILATISIFAVTTFVNFFKDILSKEELKLLLVRNNIDQQNSLIGVLGQLILLVISALLTYYLTVQVFTYDRRFVNTILKSSVYIDEDDQIIDGLWNKVLYSISHFTSGI